LPAAWIAFLATGSSASNLSLKAIPPSGYLRLEKMGLQFSTRLRPFARAWAIGRLTSTEQAGRFRPSDPHFRYSGILGTGRHIGAA
jgi:hypothetical protein